MPDPVAPAPVIQLSAITVVNAISLREGAVAPGEIAAIFGTGLGPDAGVTGALDADGVLPATLGGVEVRFDGTPAPLFYAQSGQVNVQVPYTVAGSATVGVEVRYQGKLVGVGDRAGSALRARDARPRHQSRWLAQRAIRARPRDPPG